ncbi:MAG TPA: hypothetical protein EYG38_18695 [Verrucomicrobia bacterium]|nr:hypothetical protein [Verrucomicrobiota bacterium]
MNQGDRKPIFIAVIGGSGSGKTWLVEKLIKRIGPDAGAISLDSFYLDLSHLTIEERKHRNFDSPEAIDWPCLSEIMNSCRVGHAIRIPDYDFHSHCRLAKPLNWKAPELIFIDGLWLIHVKPLRKLFRWSLFLDIPSSTRLERRLDRDQKERGREISSIRRQFKQWVEPMHRRFILPQLKWADQVLTESPNRDEWEVLTHLMQSFIAE